MKSYVEKMKDYISENIFFTNQDVIKITRTTCPHGVVQSLRRIYKITDEYITKNGKRFKLYKYEGRIRNSGVHS